MNAILGFGQHHAEVTRRFCDRVASAIIAGGAEESVAAVVSGEGTFKDKGWRIARLRRFGCAEFRSGATAIVAEGTYSHIRDDHPLSPDGFASLDVPWCVTVFFDDIWGTRTHVAIGL
jgi:hypothetical protein